MWFSFLVIFQFINVHSSRKNNPEIWGKIGFAVGINYGI